MIVYAVIENPSLLAIKNQDDLNRVISTSTDTQLLASGEAVSIYPAFHQLDAAEMEARSNTDMLPSEYARFSVVAVDIQTESIIQGSEFEGGMSVFSLGLNFQASYGNYEKAHDNEKAQCAIDKIVNAVLTPKPGVVGSAQGIPAKTKSNEPSFKAQSPGQASGSFKQKSIKSRK